MFCSSPERASAVLAAVVLSHRLPLQDLMHRFSKEVMSEIMWLIEGNKHLSITLITRGARQISH